MGTVFDIAAIVITTGVVLLYAVLASAITGPLKVFYTVETVALVGFGLYTVCGYGNMGVSLVAAGVGLIGLNLLVMPALRANRNEHSLFIMGFGGLHLTYLATVAYAMAERGQLAVGHWAALVGWIVGGSLVTYPLVKP